MDAVGVEDGFSRLGFSADLEFSDDAKAENDVSCGYVVVGEAAYLAPAPFSAKKTSLFCFSDARTIDELARTTSTS